MSPELGELDLDEYFDCLAKDELCDMCGVCEDESVPVASAEASPERRFDITVDSGGGKSVMPPGAAPEYELQTSQGQSEGQHFVGAG